MQVRLLWEFRGPDAEKTAQHFEQHLRDFFRRHDLEMPSGITSMEGLMWAAYCDPPDLPQALVQSESGRTPDREAIADQVGRALRPTRVEIS